MAIGLFHGAVIMSSPGGVGSATSYSELLTIKEVHDRMRPVLQKLSCHEDLACLRKVPAAEIVAEANNANFVVVDGSYVTSRHLNVANHPGLGRVAHVPTIWGVMENDGAGLTTWPTMPIRSLVEGLHKSLFLNHTEATRIIESHQFSYHNSGNIALDVFNLSQRISTDDKFRCVTQATALAGAKTGTLGPTWLYEMDRAIGKTDGEKPTSPRATKTHPLGDPALPYFKSHGAESHFFLGTWGEGRGLQYRNLDDLYATQLINDYLGAFVRNHNPNPSFAFLRAREYLETLRTVSRVPWYAIAANKPTGNLQHLDWPPRHDAFIDTRQCAFLGIPNTYYLDR